MSDIAPDAEAQTDQQNDKVNKSSYRLYLNLPEWVRLAVKVCLGLWLLNFLLGILPIAERGTFGDTFGAANSLFSALALLGVAWSVSMQREELRLTRDDRNDTKKNLAQTQELLKIQEANIQKQNTATTKQMFEATFFQMFSAFSDVTREIQVEFVEKAPSDRAKRIRTPDEAREDIKRRTKKASGRDAFEIMIDRLKHLFDVNMEHRQKEDPDGEEDGIDENFFIPALSDERQRIVYNRAYNTFFQQHGDDIGRYFRTLYTIMSFVQTAEIPDQDRKTYIKFVRAQLSMHEATMLMLNYLSPYSTERFNDLCVRYGMGKNADWNNPILTQMSNRLPKELRGRQTET